MMSRPIDLVFDFLRRDDLPVMARTNYMAELGQMSLWGMVAGAMDAGIVSIVASKTFGASEWLTTLVWSLPVVINVLNVVWGVLIRDRPRLRVFRLICGGAVLGMLSIGLTGLAGRWGGWLFAAQVGFTHLFLSGLITLQTTMWQVNYPQSHRARIAGRLQTVRVLTGLLTGAALAALFDWQAWAFQVAYPLVALCGLASLWPLRRMRMRGEKAGLRQVQRAAADTPSQPALTRLWAGVREAGRILWVDGAYTKYQSAQFLIGAANFLAEPLLVNVVTKRWEFRYFESQLIITLIPVTVQLLAIRFWGPLFDRVGVLRFRVLNTLDWLLSYAGLALTMLVLALGGPGWMPLALGVLCLARVANGIGRGGAVIAWFIGHLHFARAHQTELYMGIHVGLTGIRALTMPQVGLLCTALVGDWAFGIALAIGAAGHMLFRRLAAADTRPAAPEAKPPRERDLDAQP